VSRSKQYIIPFVFFFTVEQSELFWIQTNQKTIRVDLYQGLRDIVEDSYNTDDVVEMGQQGRCIILPSSHSGSPRHMFQLFQDSMAICHQNQKPDLFITMTANPKWPKIEQVLLEINIQDPNSNHYKTAADHPDIVARVFQQKKNVLLKDVREGILLYYIFSNKLEAKKFL
jgi:Helitron helicase-like domain at N-terminus